jgi:LysM repeat protein
MKNLWRVFLGIIVAAVSICLVLGIFSLSLAEGKVVAAPGSTLTLESTYPPTVPPVISSTASPTPSPTSVPTTSASLTPSLTSTRTPSPSPTLTSCPSPVGWISYIVQSGDTFEKIAARYLTSSTILQQANCLLPKDLLPGLVIIVPPSPAQTTVACAPLRTWISYTVQPGDTLYHLSQVYGITVAEIQRANCLGASTLLHTGQVIFVPPWAPLITTPTALVVSTLTLMPTITLTPGSPSNTPTELPTVVTDTPVPSPSDTPVPTDIPVVAPTETLVVTP